MNREFPKEIIDGLGGDSLETGDWRWGVSVEVIYEDDIVGHIKPYGDSWLGFYPLAVTE